MATRLWNFLTTDLQGLVPADPAPSVTDAADVVLGLATALAEAAHDRPTLAPQVASLIYQLDSLLDALNAPLGKLVQEAPSFASTGNDLLTFYREVTQKEPTLAQTIALMSQAAYLESFREFVKRHPKVEQWLLAKDSTPQAKTITLEMKALGLFELTDDEACRSALTFPQSALAKAFNRALNARLEQLGATPEMAHRMVESVAKNSSRHLQSAIARADRSIQQQLDCDRP
jgi:hypothetical protein